jgi:hypothetical protein
MKKTKEGLEAPEAAAAQNYRLKLSVLLSLNESFHGGCFPIFDQRLILRENWPGSGLLPLPGRQRSPSAPSSKDCWPATCAVHYEAHVSPWFLHQSQKTKKGQLFDGFFCGKFQSTPTMQNPQDNLLIGSS